MIISGQVYTIPNRVLVDKRAVTGAEIVEDDFTIPAGYTGPTIFLRVNEVPLDTIPIPGYTGPIGYVIVELADSPFTRFQEVNTGLPGPGQYLVDTDTYKFGYVALNPTDGGKNITVKYYGKGSLVFAADINGFMDGSILYDEAIRARHINQSDSFTFGATLTVEGNFVVKGVINKDATEIIDFTDDILKLNSGATMPGPDVGLEVDRGGLNPQLVWDEGDDAWLARGTTGINILSIGDNKIVKVCDEGLFMPPLRASDPSPTIGMIPGIYHNTTDNQTKQIVSDGLGGAKIIILG